MELEKRFTCYKVTRWQGECPSCNKKDSQAIFTSEGRWYVKYRCNNCKTVFAFNQGDAMGGQEDHMEIYEPGKY